MEDSGAAELGLDRAEFRLLGEIAFLAMDFAAPDLAESILRNMLYIEPQNIGVKLGLAISLLSQNKNIEVIKLLENVEDDEAKLWLSFAYKQHGMPNEFSKRLEQLAKIGTHTQVLKLIYYLLGYNE